MKFLQTVFLWGLINTISAQTQIPMRKTAYAGGFLVVPENVTWNVDRVFVQDGDMYSIQISNKNFNASYASGDTIRLPYYVAEMELLTKKDLVLYNVYLNEIKK